jgi:hypothetical protein
MPLAIRTQAVWLRPCASCVQNTDAHWSGYRWRSARLFREGRLDDAIAELRCGLEVHPQHATGYSNLGFLYLRKGQLEQVVACLLQALAVDPQHKDAPDHLFDVLRTLIDELVQIGLTDGFLSTQPGGKFDAYNRHRWARAIGHLIAKIGHKGIFKADGRVLEHDLLLEIVLKDVHKKMAYCSHSTDLKFASQGIRGWNPPVAIPLAPSANIACRGAGCTPYVCRASFCSILSSPVIDGRESPSRPATPGRE